MIPPFLQRVGSFLPVRGETSTGRSQEAQLPPGKRPLAAETDQGKRKIGRLRDGVVLCGVESGLKVRQVTLRSADGWEGRRSAVFFSQSVYGLHNSSFIPLLLQPSRNDPAQPNVISANRPLSADDSASAALVRSDAPVLRSGTFLLRVVRLGQRRSPSRPGAASFPPPDQSLSPPGSLSPADEKKQ